MVDSFLVRFGFRERNDGYGMDGYIIGLVASRCFFTECDVKFFEWVCFLCVYLSMSIHPVLVKE